MLYAPIPADQIRPFRRGIPGVCKWGGANGPILGRFIPYRRTRAYSKACFDAMIDLLLQDLSEGSTFCSPFPFVLDTGTDVTIIPREKLPSNAFPKDKALKPDRIQIDTAGGPVDGLLYEATLAILPIQMPSECLGFGRLEIMVVDGWPWDCGMLGLNAVRRVLIVSSKDHVIFWPDIKEEEWMVRIKN